MKDTIILLGILLALGNSFVVFITFFNAYLFGNYHFGFKINSFGEAHIEAIIVPVTLALSIYSAWYLSKLWYYNKLEMVIK